jgi:hypothetical protein
MAGFVEGVDRGQNTLFPVRLDSAAALWRDLLNKLHDRVTKFCIASSIHANAGSRLATL